MTKSIRTLFTVPLVTLIVVLATVIIGVSYYNGQRAVGDIGTHLHHEISARIRQHIHHFLQAPDLVNALNANLDTSDFDFLAQQFQHQVNVSDMPYVFYGNEQGNFIGVQRVKGKTELKIRDAESAPLRHIYEIDKKGQRISHQRPKEYDPRDRPWYRDAKKVGKTTWTDLYVSKHRDVFQITQAVPVYDENNKLRGVFGANFILSQISDFLTGMKIGQTGQAFIMEHTGKLVAASIDTPLSVGGKKRPLSASRSRDPAIQSVAQHITRKWNSISLFAKQQRSEVVKLDGQTTELSVYSRRGIRWIIAVTIPDTDFTEGIKYNTLWTLGLSLLAVGLAIIVGIFAAQHVTKPILQLNRHVKQLSNSDWKTWILDTDIKRQDELGELALSFTSMAKQLAGLLGAFEEKVDYAVENVQQTNADLEAFYRSVADDLRSPISEIVEFAERLLGSHNDQLDMHGRHFLQVILSSGKKSTEIIDSLLLLLAIISKDEVEIRPLNMRPIILLVTQQLEPEKKKYYGSIAVPNKLPDALGYSPWIKEVWMNYLSNGLKYGGVPANLEIGAEVKDGVVKYWVQDHGEGMTENKASTLFVEALRLDKHRSREGHGFGLSIVHRIVTKLGGEVGVESLEGKGSRFWFTLPQR
jgi:signal transduction histidine kinase